MSRGGGASKPVSPARTVCRKAAQAFLAVLLILSVPFVPSEDDEAQAAETGFADHTVEGVSTSGTVINLFDYWNTVEPFGEDDADTDQGINANHQLHFNGGKPYSVSGNPALNTWTGEGQGPLTGMVESLLGEDGYPSLKDGNVSNPGYEYGDPCQISRESLAYLFSPNDYESDADRVPGKKSYLDVDGLLQVDSDGYYYYNAASSKAGENGSFASANFASFDEESNSFVLYDQWAVNKVGTYSQDGQFFPFNKPGDVFYPNVGGELASKNVRSDDSVLNHYFGMSMSTRFVQQDGGMVKNKPVTYEFSGDDDVWIYIDGVLVADLGGIHDAASVKIDFSTGDITVASANGTVTKSTLKQAFEGAERYVADGWRDNTFADNTYHTLDFFYLERGNNDSNISLKYNLVTVPESRIVKVDQNGEPVPEAQFGLYALKGDQEELVSTGTTNANGELVLLDAEDDFLLSLDKLETEYGKNAKFVLKEIYTPEGYRSSGESRLHLENGILFSDSTWDNGTYAQARVTTVLPSDGSLQGAGSSSDKTFGFIGNDGTPNGTVFAVVLQYQGGDDISDESAWRPITGDALGGWHVSDVGADGATSMDDILNAAKENRHVAQLTSSGEYRIDVEGLPGDVKKYYWYQNQGQSNGAESAEYTVAYYYTKADSLDSASADDTYRLSSGEWERIFSADLFVSNVKNNLLVQKVDEKGNAVNGAKFGLFEEDQIRDAGGSPSLREDATPLQEAETRTLSGVGGIHGEVSGMAAFTSIPKGTYYLAETYAPDGYRLNGTLTKVVVDATGVYADAGGQDDGVSVLRGLGKVLGSVEQFTVDDAVDATLHDVKATFVTADSYANLSSALASWKGEGSEVRHFSYVDPTDGNTPSGTIFDYAPTGGVSAAFETDAGWSKLVVQQCYGDEGDHGGLAASVDKKQNLEGQDITQLYSGSVAVRVVDQRVANLTVKKEVDGIGAPTNASFDFTLELTDGADKSFVQDGTVIAAKKISAGGATESVDLKFNGETTSFSLKPGERLEIADLPYGTHYEVVENEVMQEGFAFESASVEGGYGTPLADGGSTVSGSIGLDGSAGDNTKPDVSVTFTNSYEATLASVAINATKTLTGRGMQEGEFTFKVVDANGDVVTTGENEAASDGSSGEINFGSISYTSQKLADDLKSGAATLGETDSGLPTYTYQYTVSEVTEDLSSAGVTPSASVFEITVVLTEDSSGWKAEVLYPAESSGLGFENEYAADSVTIDINGNKTLESEAGLTPPEIGGGYEFTIEADEGMPLPGTCTTTNDEAGNVEFGPIEYGLKDLGGGAMKRFEYRISESGSVDGVTNDQNDTKTVTVTVADDGQGHLTATVNDGTSGPAFTFTNVYSVAPVESSPTGGGIEVKKSLAGRALVAGEFSFQLKDEAGNVVSEGTNDADGKVSLSGVEFKAPGTYTYQLSEVVESDPSIDYDDAEYTLVAEVTDGRDGTLSVEWSVAGDGEGVSASKSITFENAYNGGGVPDPSPDPVPDPDPDPAPDPDPEPGPGTDPGTTVVAIEATKELQGRDLMPGEFSFELKDAEGTLIGRAVNDADGKIVFNGVEYSEPGVYRYFVSETQGDKEGVVYDASVHEVEVVVAEGDDGLVATVSPENVVFENTYVPPEESPDNSGLPGGSDEPEGPDGGTPEMPGSESGSDGGLQPSSESPHGNAVEAVLAKTGDGVVLVGLGASVLALIAAVVALVARGRSRSITVPRGRHAR